LLRSSAVIIGRYDWLSALLSSALTVLSYRHKPFLRVIAKKVCTACSGTGYKVCPLTNLNKYLHNDASETEVNVNITVNNGTGKF
jgi:hypothetical protein